MIDEERAALQERVQDLAAIVTKQNDIIRAMNATVAEMVKKIIFLENLQNRVGQIATMLVPRVEALGGIIVAKEVCTQDELSEVEMARIVAWKQAIDSEKSSIIDPGAKGITKAN